MGPALLLAFTGTTAGAAPHAPGVARGSTAADGTRADGPPSGAAISADGRHVAFTSTAPGLGCAHFTPRLLPTVNADGTVVAFESASPDLVEGDTSGVSDVFLRTVQ
ncbi:hypothetical protein AB5J49_33330 [Streptomyces sp. R28]|uniref:WD40 repeat protein n=1 Tax=Streptomyces sp. R28 TaxID=3238628 RepID=A0AB39Q5S6_9ACTN